MSSSSWRSRSSWPSPLPCHADDRRPLRILRLRPSGHAARTASRGSAKRWPSPACEAWQFLMPGLEGFREARLTSSASAFVEGFREARLRRARAGRELGILSDAPRYVLEIVFVIAIVGISILLFATGTPAQAHHRPRGVCSRIPARIAHAEPDHGQPRHYPHRTRGTGHRVAHDGGTRGGRHARGAASKRRAIHRRHRDPRRHLPLPGCRRTRPREGHADHRPEPDDGVRGLQRSGQEHAARSHPGAPRAHGRLDRVRRPADPRRSRRLV